MFLLVKAETSVHGHGIGVHSEIVQTQTGSDPDPGIGIVIRRPRQCRAAADTATAETSAVDTILNDIVASVEDNEVEHKVKALVDKLRERLKITNGYVSRPRGGVQYSPACILESVLLADNLKPLAMDTDLLPEVVHQSGPHCD